MKLSTCKSMGGLLCVVSRYVLILIDCYINRLKLKLYPN